MEAQGMRTQAAEEREISLLRRIAEGDGEAFRELFDLRAPLVLGVLVRIVQDRAGAEEALQEVFLQVRLLAGSYRPEQATPFSWILTMARTQAIDLLRRRPRLSRPPQEVALPSRDGPASRKSPSPSPGAGSSEAERLRDRAFAALQHLDQRFGLFSAA